MSEVARKRWKLLGDILMNRRLESRDDCLSDVSVRRFSSFNLFMTQHLTDEDDKASRETTNKDENHRPIWLRYTSSYFPSFSVSIRHLDQNICFNDLFGFNNTGNVCVWPSEEILTYYCVQHSELFLGKSVCELGGGMTCLAGVALATYCEANHVLLTDGNVHSIENVEFIIEKNKNNFKSNHVDTRLLLWDAVDQMSDITNSFDWIISADCLFFDECRASLLRTIEHLLKPGGEAIIFAPSCGETFDEFAKMVTGNMVIVENTRRYDDIIWNLHTKNLEQGISKYDESLHFPRLLRLKKLTLL